MFRAIFRMTKRPQSARTQSSIFDQANQLASQGKKDEAIGELNKILKDDPGNKAARARIAILEDEQNTNANQLKH